MKDLQVRIEIPGEYDNLYKFYLFLKGKEIPLYSTISDNIVKGSKEIEDWINKHHDDIYNS